MIIIYYFILENTGIKIWYQSGLYPGAIYGLGFKRFSMGIGNFKIKVTPFCLESFI